MKIIGIILSTIIATILLIPIILVYVLENDVKFTPLSYMAMTQVQILSIIIATRFNKWFVSKIK